MTKTGEINGYEHGSITLAIPYVVFEVRKDGKPIGSYAIDCHFVRFLQYAGRITTLIKREGPSFTEKPLGGDKVLEVMIKPDEVEDLLKSVYVDLETQLRATRIDRISHMRRWNLFRMLIPTGHYVHIHRDEEMAKKEREAQLSLAILNKVLDVKGSEELEEVSTTPKGIIYYRVSLMPSEAEREGRKKRRKDPYGTVVDETGKRDPIYSNLLSFDELFREAFLRAVRMRVER